MAEPKARVVRRIKYYTTTKNGKKVDYNAKTGTPVKPDNDRSTKIQYDPLGPISYYGDSKEVRAKKDPKDVRLGIIDIQRKYRKKQAEKWRTAMEMMDLQTGPGYVIPPVRNTRDGYLNAVNKTVATALGIPLTADNKAVISAIYLDEIRAGKNIAVKDFERMAQNREFSKMVKPTYDRKGAKPGVALPLKNPRTIQAYLDKLGDVNPAYYGIKDRFNRFEGQTGVRRTRDEIKRDAALKREAAAKRKAARAAAKMKKELEKIEELAGTAVDPLYSSAPLIEKRRYVPRVNMGDKPKEYVLA